MSHELTDFDVSQFRSHLRGAVSLTDAVLVDLLPAGPDDKKPPPDWPHWQLCHQLQQAKLLLSSALRDLAER